MRIFYVHGNKHKYLEDGWCWDNLAKQKSWFPPLCTKLSHHGILIRFKELGMGSLVWNGLQRQPQSGWWLPPCSAPISWWVYLAYYINVVVYRICSFVRPFLCLYPFPQKKPVHLHLNLSKLVKIEEVFSFIEVLFLYILHPKYLVSSEISS